MALKINDNGVDREMTADEISALELWRTQAENEAATKAEAQAAKSAAKQAVLDKLGLTADEAAALFG